MADKFDFGYFLRENGFSYSNFGTHNLYEISRKGKDYAVNIEHGKFTAAESETNGLIVDHDLPKDEKAAKKWLSEFLGEKIA